MTLGERMIYDVRELRKTLKEHRAYMKGAKEYFDKEFKAMQSQEDNLCRLLDIAEQKLFAALDDGPS